MTKDERVKVGSVLQIDPQHDERFGASLLVVTEVKSWGVQGYIRVPQVPKASNAFYRVEWAKVEYIGESAWLAVKPDTDEAEQEPKA